MGERGNAPAEFVLVSALLVSLVLGLLQVLFVGYARHALTAAASEGARQASLPDVSGEQALALTRALITQSLSETYASEVSLARSTRLGIPTSEMIITAPITMDYRRNLSSQRSCTQRSSSLRNSRAVEPLSNSLFSQFRCLSPSSISG